MFYNNIVKINFMGGSVKMSTLLVIIYLAVIVFELASMWILFQKANQPGWAAIIPVYNTYIMLKIGKKPGWWLVLLFFVPIANIVISILMISAFVKAYGKEGVGSVLLAIFFGIIYFPYLAFSKDVQYVNVDVNAEASTDTNVSV